MHAVIEQLDGDSQRALPTHLWLLLHRLFAVLNPDELEICISYKGLQISSYFLYVRNPQMFIRRQDMWNDCEREKCFSCRFLNVKSILTTLHP